MHDLIVQSTVEDQHYCPHERVRRTHHHVKEVVCKFGQVDLREGVGVECAEGSAKVHEPERQASRQAERVSVLLLVALVETATACAREILINTRNRC